MIYNDIPVMDDPLGAYWEQPADIREAPMDDTLVLLTKRQFEALPEYSTSTPSGVYPGKCWKGAEFERVKENTPLWDAGGRVKMSGRWFLRWYGISPDPKLCTNNQRLIEVVI